MLGLALDFNPHKMLNIYAQGSGLYAGSYGYVYDAEIGIKLIPIKILSIVGGYRIMEFKAEHDDDYAKVKLYGPLLACGVHASHRLTPQDFERLWQSPGIFEHPGKSYLAALKALWKQERKN